MKRFTETNKWRDAWFRKLSGAGKLLWVYLTDNCDSVGLIELDYKLLSSDLGIKITRQHMIEFGDRIQQVSESRFFLPKFIGFQYGELSEKCPPHRTVIHLISMHGMIRNGMIYTHPSGHSIGNSKPVEIMVPEITASLECVEIIEHLNRLTGRDFKPEADSGLPARLKETDVTTEGIKQMISRQVKLWKDDPKMQEFLRPSTLFRPSKFNEYYAARELPVPSREIGREIIHSLGNQLTETWATPTKAVNICIKDWATYLSLDDHNDPELRLMIEACARFCLRFRNRQSPSWLTLMGKTGTGKTHCARRIWQKLHDRLDWTKQDWLPAEIYWPRMVADLRSGEAYERVAAMARWPMLFLDDIGAERDTTGFASDQLSALLGQRSRRWTILTSNLSLDQIAAVDTRLADRIIREPGNEVVDLQTISHALRKKP